MKSRGERRSGASAVWTGALLVFFLACGQPPQDAGGGSSPSSGPKAASGAVQRSKRAARPELSLLGADERRVALLVVPGDALVEVDGRPAYRRGGAIDLTGKVGDVRRVRVWKGAKTTGEKAVTIQEGRPSPAIIDLNEAPPPKPVGKGPKKPTSFGGFGD
jgi:hypothetical protein